MRLLQKSTLAALLGSLLLLACESPVSDPLMISIEGLKYEVSDGFSGYTDANGLITGVAGETVEFFLGDVALGEAIAADDDALNRLVSSYFPQTQTDMNAALYWIRHDGSGQGVLESITSDYSLDYRHTASQARLKLVQLSNIAQLVMAFDDDQDISNGISIRETVHNYFTDASLDFSADFNTIQFQRDTKLALADSLTEGHITQIAVPETGVALAWAHEQIGNLPTPMIWSEVDYNGPKSRFEIAHYQYSDEGLLTELQIDEDKSGHTNLSTVWSYDSYGRVTRTEERSRDNGIDNWTSDSVATLTINEANTEEVTTTVQGALTKTLTNTLNAAGQLTQSNYQEDSVTVFDETISYQANKVDRATYSKNYDGGELEIHLYDTDGNITEFLIDTDQDGTAEQYVNYDYDVNGNLTTQTGYTGATYTTAPLVVNLGAATEQFQIVSTYNSAQQVLTYQNTVGNYGSCTDALFHADVYGTITGLCVTFSHVYSYTDGLRQTDTANPDSNSNSYTLSYSYHSNSQISETEKVVTVPDAETLIVQYNEAGDEILRTTDSGSDGNVNQRKEQLFTNGLLVTEKHWMDYSADSTLFQLDEFIYDSDGNLVTRQYSSADGDEIVDVERRYINNNGLVTSYQYVDMDPETVTVQQLFEYQAGRFTYLSY